MPDHAQNQGEPLKEFVLRRGKAIALGCLGVGLLGFVGTIAAIGFLYQLSHDLEGIRVSVDAPLDVTFGDTFGLVVTVTNQRDELLTLSYIDIADEYLAGFVVVSVDPIEESVEHIPLDNSMSYTFNAGIPTGGTRVFTFNLRAEDTGSFRGHVHVVADLRFTSLVAQTVVSQAAEQPTI